MSVDWLVRGLHIEPTYLLDNIFTMNKGNPVLNQVFSGLRDNLQENPIFNGNIYGFRLRFSQQNQSIELLLILPMSAKCTYFPVTVTTCLNEQSPTASTRRIRNDAYVTIPVLQFLKSESLFAIWGVDPLGLDPLPFKSQKIPEVHNIIMGLSESRLQANLIVFILLPTWSWIGLSWFFPIKMAVLSIHPFQTHPNKIIMTSHDVPLYIYTYIPWIISHYILYNHYMYREL